MHGLLQIRGSINGHTIAYMLLILSQIHILSSSFNIKHFASSVCCVCECAKKSSGNCVLIITRPYLCRFVVKNVKETANIYSQEIFS